MHEDDDWDRNLPANASSFPPCSSLTVPFGTPPGASLITAILDAFAKTFSRPSWPAIILPKIDFGSVVFIILFAALAASFAFCRLRDKKHIECLGETIAVQHDKLAALSKEFDKLGKIQQEQDQHTQTLQTRQEEAEARANDTRHTLNNLRNEVEKKEEAHRTQLTKLHGDAEKLRESHEKEFRSTKANLKKQNDNLKNEVRLGNSTICQLQADFRSTRDELDGLQAKYEDTLKSLNTEKLDHSANKAEWESRAQELKRKNATVVELQNHFQSIRSELADLKRKHEEVLTLLSTEKLDHTAIKAELGSRMQELIATQKEKVASDSAFERVTTELEEVKGELEDVKTELKQMRTMFSGVTTELDDTRTQPSEATTKLEEVQPSQGSASDKPKRKHRGGKKHKAPMGDGQKQETIDLPPKESATSAGESLHTDSESESEAAGDEDEGTTNCSDLDEQSPVSFPPSKTTPPPADQPKVKPFKYLTSAEFTALKHKQRRKYNSYRRAHEEEVKQSQAQTPDSSNNGSDVPDPSLNPFVKDFIPGSTRTDYQITENGLVKPKVPKDIRRPGPPWRNGGLSNTNRLPPQNDLLLSRYSHGPTRYSPFGPQAYTSY